MARRIRATAGGMVYHVLNRGNGRMRLFRKGGDYEAFERVLAEGLERYPVELFTYCMMPNHWHLVVRPKTDEALGRWMGWVGVTHVRRHHEHYHTRGGLSSQKAAKSVMSRFRLQVEGVRVGPWEGYTGTSCVRKRGHH